jgi:hypothetical protein
VKLKKRNGVGWKEIDEGGMVMNYWICCIFSRFCDKESDEFLGLTMNITVTIFDIV